MPAMSERPSVASAHRGIRLRQAVIADAERLPAIERSAGEAFRQIARLAWIADGEDQSVERHRELIGSGTAWVAAEGPDEPIGFLSAEPVGGDLHIWELAVRLEHQGHGIGRALVAMAQDWVRAHRAAAITLTTFRAIPWNEPFYHSVGFATLAGDALTPRLARILAAEAAAGMPPGERCAMIWQRR